MYPGEWHRIYGDKTGESARLVMAHLLPALGPASVVEVGCGNAHWTQAAADAGVSDYLVADGPWNDRTALLVPADRFRTVDLRAPLDLGRRFDLAICLETAEHVDGAHADLIVDGLVGLADTVLFGAAIPLQGGHGHVNEQWPSWWAAKFAARGYAAFDLVRPRFWTDRRLHYWYRQNAFVYVDATNAAATARAQAAAALGGGSMPDAVHPEKYEEMASYRALALKRLARALPGWAMRRVRSKLAGHG